MVVIFLNALGATTWAYYIRKRWFREGFFGKNTFILLCEIFLFNQVAQINRSKYKSDIEEDEECRGIYVILHVKVHGLKFEKKQTLPSTKLHLSVSCLLLRAIKLTETVQNVNFQNLCNKNDKQLSSTIIQLSIYQIHHIYNPQMFFPTQMSFPSLPLTPWDLCWMCWIRWRDVGFVGSATRSRERFFEPPERRTAAMRIAMRPLDFSMDFFPPKKGRFGFTLGGRIWDYPRLDLCVSTAKSEMIEDDAATYVKLVLEGVL